MTTQYGKEMVGEQPIKDQSESPDYESGPTIVKLSRNPSVTFGKVWLRGHPVPYIEVFKVPVDGDNQQVFPIDEDPDGTITVHPHTGPYRWELVVDQRWAYDFATETEAAHFGGALADAMAVATGRACHGSVNRLSVHGPTIRETSAESDPRSD
jgi:hypothetical protein